RAHGDDGSVRVAGIAPGAGCRSGVGACTEAPTDVRCRYAFEQDIGIVTELEVDVDPRAPLADLRGAGPAAVPTDVAEVGAPDNRVVEGLEVQAFPGDVREV